MVGVSHHNVSNRARNIKNFGLTNRQFRNIRRRKNRQWKTTRSHDRHNNRHRQNPDPRLILWINLWQHLFCLLYNKVKKVWRTTLKIKHNLLTDIQVQCSDRYELAQYWNFSLEFFSFPYFLEHSTNFYISRKGRCLGSAHHHRPKPPKN